MKKNLGTSDRAVRLLFAIVLTGLYYTHLVTGITATITLSLAGVFMLASFRSFCPLYFLLGISTRKKSREIVRSHFIFPVHAKTSIEDHCEQAQSERC